VKIQEEIPGTSYEAILMVDSAAQDTELTSTLVEWPASEGSVDD